MSFSSDAKAELCRLRPQKKNIALAECYGVLLYGNRFSAREIRLVTASPDFAALLPKLFRRAFGLDFDALPAENAGGKLRFAVEQPDKLRAIFAAFGLEPESTLSHHVNFGVLEEDEERLAFLRGAFLAGGSATDPEKGFHLELATPHRSVSRETKTLLLDLGFEPREAERGGNALLYFKRADAIADFLTAIGAMSASMGVQTAKVEKDMRNTITRRVNCDTANADKVVSAAQEQLDAIRFLVREYGLDGLPEPLRDTALLRLANPEASLADLAQLSIPPVTKSCLNHRMKKILSLAARGISLP
ncbi:MAG: DNA-binding protein WhiA [Oscillospiraceae bacterium]|nr:DNA-binding protein WhiA [Oscillospiraceae bacterium]